MTAAGAQPPRRRALLERTVLDEQVAASVREHPGSWGPWTWLGPLIAMVAIIVAGNLISVTLLPETGHGISPAGIGLSAAGEALTLLVLLAIGRPIAAREGGWRRAFGLDRIRTPDWAPWGFGLLFVYLGRQVVGVLAAVLTNGKAAAEANNLRLAHPTVGSVIALALLAVVLAPITEELMFRGLLLRSFMRRMPFWPAALLSTAIFALFHTYEVRTLAGAITLACSVAVLGLANCFLVRISGRLTSAIMVHASFNALALALAVALAHR